MRKMKKGVSLVTVLLFMMVATIAATATYKWLSSIGSSSAARLQLNEARQAALSGIEAAHSWMTNNGNDFGAVVKQYFEEGKKPILLNSVLPRMGSSKMSDSVWLMGVNVESSSRYKIKIVSLGTTRENVKYSEVAIFNVAGLYQAEIPSEVHNVAYRDAFHGSLTTAGNINVGEGGAFIKNTPAVKNAGGTASNSIYVKDYLVWDGDFYENNGASVGDLYLTGDLSFSGGSSTPLNINRNLYVGGRVYGTSTSSHMNVYGSAFLNGGMRVNDRSPIVINNGLYLNNEVTGGKFDFYGNVTSNGNIEHFNAGTSASYIEMHKNLVLNGRLVFPASASSDNYYIRVNRNAFIKENSTASGNIGSNYIQKTQFGTNVDDSLYLAQFEPHNGANDCGSLYNCAKSTNGNIYVAYNGRLVSMLLPEQYQAWNADDMAKYRNMITDESEKIDCGFSKISKDKLSFNTSLLSLASVNGTSLVHSVNAKNGCSSAIWEDNAEASAPVSALNACYNIANNANMLYDKTWLIVSWDHAPEWGSTDDKLVGNFIFVINSTSAPTKTLELPETADDAKVFIYLPNGWKNTSGGENLKTRDNSNAMSNYFIYSADDIGGFIMENSPLNGSVYMQGCSRLNSLGDNHTLAVKFNETLFKGLVKSSILCEYNESGVCLPFTGAVSSFEGIEGIDPYQTEDSYHIATSPQLIVEVESQYRNKEPLPKTTLDYDTVASSEVVLPRIIYLPRDARGRFSDYYNVVGLNGNLKAVKDPSKMQCLGAIPTGDQLLTSNGELAEGRYLCGYGDIPVFVVIEGSLSENAVVQFHDDDVEKKITPGNSTNVRLVATASDVPMKVTISVDIPEDGSWHVEPIHSGLVYDSDLGVYTLTTISSGADAAVPIFKVSSELENAAAGVYFHITNCEKCIPGDHKHAHVFTKNIATVQRKGINCSEIDESAFEQKYGFECSDLNDMPECGSLLNEEKTTWVTARGLGCVPTVKNDAWECRTGGNEVELENKLSESDFCTVYIPPMSVQLKKPDSTYKLPAELKRKRNTLVVKIEKPEGFSGSIEVKPLRENAYLLPETCSESSCTYNLYAGDSVYFSKVSENFSYFTCDGKSCGGKKPDEKISAHPFKIMLVGGVDTVKAWFGQKDAHCFYTSFQDVANGWCTQANVEQNVQCVDKCKNGTHCSVNQNSYGGAFAGSDWLMVYSNNGSQYKQLQINNSEGSATNPEGFGKRIIKGTVTGNPSVVLNRAKAGSNGMMTAMLQIPNLQGLETLEEKILKYIPSLSFNRGELLINDGLIFRSNADASEYFSLNVIAEYGVAVKGRLCYVSGQNTDIGHCYETKFKGGENDNLSKIFAASTTPLTLNVDVNGSVITATLSRNVLNGSRTEYDLAMAVFDLENNSALRTKIGGKTLNDENHQYVGFKIGYPYEFVLDIKIIVQIYYHEWFFKSYKLYDIGWRSYDYDEDCWDTPKVSCSFKSNYTGGMVPFDDNVTPWVGMSSWFHGKNCKVFYYYNGCDVATEKFEKEIPKGMTRYDMLNKYTTLWENIHLLGEDIVQREIPCPANESKGMGLYNFSAKELRDYGNFGSLNSDKYWFKSEGYHGYAIENTISRPLLGGSTVIKGFLNEASVLVSCERDEETHNAHLYEASCGDFIVGEFERCSESYSDMLNNSKYCGTSSEGCFVELKDVYNVREAAVSIALDEFVGSQIEAYLVDEEGLSSALGSFEVTSEAEYKIDVKSISDAPGFNPQKLHGIMFKNISSPFIVQRVWSACPYEFGITCNGAHYNFAGTEWTVSASVLNPDRAEGGCEMVLIADNRELPETRVFKECSENFIQEYQHEIYGQNSRHTYKFKVLARDEKGNVLDECTTEEKEILPLEIKCWWNNSQDNLFEHVPQGTGVPSFNFKVDNCPPDDGCPFTIRYPSEYGLAPESGTVLSNIPYENPPSGNINTPDDKLSKGTYTYGLDVLGHGCPSGVEFEVIGEPEKGTCSNERIVLKEDGEYFEADVTFADGGYWKGTILDSVTVVYTDVLGNVIDVKKEDQELKSETFEFKKELTVSHKLPDGMGSCAQGVCNYVVNFKIYGDNNCSVKWTARAIRSISNSSCLTAPITNQDPSSKVSFTPVIGGCEDGGCSWTLTGASQPFGGSGYNGTDALTFSDPGAAGTKTYQFRVFPTDSKELSSEPQSCNFSVTYKPEATQVTECYFDGSVDWGKQAKYSFTTNCANCSYSLKPASGSAIAGMTSSTAGSATEVTIDNVTKQEVYTLTVNGKTIVNCAGTPVLNDVKARCNINKDELYDDESAIFTASFDVCQNGYGCDWTWELKKNEGNSTGNVSTVNSGNVNSKASITQAVTGSGTYSLYLNGSATEACEPIVVSEKIFTPRVGSCSFDKQKYMSGSQVVFNVSGIYARNQSWSVKDDNGNVVASGNNLTLENQQYSPALNFTASKDKEGVYQFCLSSGECCDGATLVVEEKPPLECNKKKSCGLFSCSYSLVLTSMNCANCKYAVKWGSSKTKQANVSVTKVEKVSNNQDVNCRRCDKIKSDTRYQIILNGNNQELINCAEP